MDREKYTKILKAGERVDWHGANVPNELITSSVRLWADALSHEIDKIESELDDLKGVSLDKRKAYLQSLKNNLKDCPYTLNGDFYLIKKRAIEKEMAEDKKVEKPKKTKEKVVKETTKKEIVSSKTKNSDLIFGKKTK